MNDLDIRRIAPLLAYGDHADLFGEQSRFLSVRWEGGRIEEINEGTDVGFGLRYLQDETVFFGQQNALTADDIVSVSEGLVQGLSRKRVLADVGETEYVRHTVAVDPLAVPLDKKIRLLENVYRHIRGAGPEIAQVICLYVERSRENRILTSAGRHVREDRTQCLMMISVIAARGGLLQTATELIGGLGGFELVDEPAVMDRAADTARRACEKLSAPPAPVGEMPVVISADAGGTMIHEAVGHSLEADLVQKGISPVYQGKIGEVIASPLVTVVDDPTLAGQRGSYAFDDEGEPARKVVLIEDGRLSTYLYDIASALKDGVPSNGHGRRQSYRNRPIPRMANTFILPGKDDPKEIIASLSDGLLVKKMGGGQVNTATGDFVFEIEEGYHVRGGKIQGLVRGANLLGNGPKVLRTIDRLGNDLGWGLGTCGKEGQGVPVSDAQPTLRIPKILIGGS